MTTIRRNLRLKFEELITREAIFCSDGAELEFPCKERIEQFAELLADAALEVFEQKPSFNFSKAGIEWSIIANRDITQETQDAAVLEKETIDAFESAFSIKGNWNWYPSKPQEMRVWEAFREFLVKLYRVDKDCFTKYFTWAHQPYSRGAMTGRQIKNSPQDFPDAWAAFCAGAMYQKPRSVVPDKDRNDLDGKGAPMSYG